MQWVTSDGSGRGDVGVDAANRTEGAEADERRGPSQDSPPRAEETGAHRVMGERYRLVERIGAGGMASIYRARDLTLERDVAVKVLHAHLADEPPVLARFRTEAQHAAALAHPHVVSVFDQGGEQQPYIVMEFVDGPSLRELVRRRGRVPPEEALALLDPVCRALHRAHSLGMIHRDIKPENVLITGDGVVKVADFGIARAIEGSNHTQTGALVGSVHYLAPELVDHQRATAASDQYAVGVMLFELLTGRKALPAESPVAVALRHAREPIPPPSEFASDVPAALDEVIARACAFDPADRYADLAELLSALHAAVAEGPAPVTIPRDQADASTVVAPAEETPVPPSSPTGATPVPRSSRRRRRGRLRTGRRLATTAGMIGVLLVLLGAGSAAAWHWLIAPVQQMPQLQGLRQPEAERVLDGLGLIPNVDQQHTMSDPEGAVIGQDPPAGNELRRGSEVELIVSAGPDTVEMADVTGKPLGEARQILENEPYYFDIHVQERFHDTAPPGEVILQSVNPGETIEQGERVTLRVSLGVEQVEVPDVTGLMREKAEARLADADLSSAVTTTYSDTVPNTGEVIEQSIEAGTKVDVESEVELTVSLGPLTIEVPDLRGQPVEAAVTELEQLDLEVNVIRQPRPRIGPFVRGEEGRVEELAPAPGSSIERGQRIDVYTFDDDAAE